MPLLSIAKMILSKKKQGEAEPNCPIQENHVQAILDAAVLQRTKVELVFSTQGAAPRTVPCVLRELGPTYLELELPGFLNVSPSWKGKEVEGFLNLLVQQKHRVHYTFSATVQDFISSEGTPCILISLPRKLTLGQKRMHLRISPPSRHVRDITLLRSGSRREVLDGVARLHKLASAVEDENKGQVHVQNLSAGGIRLCLHPKTSPEPVSVLKDSQYVLFHLQLEPNDPCEALSFFILGRIRNMFQDSESENLEMGLQFEAMTASPASSSSGNWVRISPETGIEEIGDWVFKLHLELYREKGLT